MNRWGVLMIALAGCAADGSLGAGDRSPPTGAVDSGAGPAVPADDAGLDQSEWTPPGLDATPLDPSTPDAPAPGGAPSEDGDGRNTATCYDGLDNSDDDMVDCDDPGCQGLRSCCVGRGDCCAPTVVDLPLFDLDVLKGCADLANCFASPLESFGNAPYVEPADLLGGLSFPGDRESESGLVMSDPIDLRSHRLRFELSVTLPDCESCLESVAVGFTNQASLGTESVRPAIGLVVSGARREAALLVGGAIAGRWDIEGETALSRWTIDLDPRGVVHIFAEDETEPRASESFETSSTLRLVLWGHSQNAAPTGLAGARIQSLSATVLLCDMPKAWSERGQVGFRIGDEVNPVTTGATPSVANDREGRTKIAIEVDDGIHLAERGDDGILEPIGDQWQAALAPSPGETIRYRQPEIVSVPELTEGDGLRLYVTMEDELGRSIGVSDANNDIFDYPQRIIRPEDLAAEAVDGASVTRISDGTWVMALRVLVDGRYRIVTMSSGDGMSWVPRSEVDTTELNVDEIAEPSIIVHDNAYQLLVATRRGTRWSQALFASDELQYWRLVEREALTPMIESDDLGVVSADAIDRVNEIEVYYSGMDGQRLTLHRAVRRASTGGSFIR